MPRFIHTLLLASSLVLAVAAPAAALELAVSTENTHVLSLRVMAHDKEVMAPVLQVAAGKPASVAMSNREGPMYTLVTTTQPPMGEGAPATGGVQLSLWKGDEDSGIRMIEGRVFANGTRTLSDGQGTTVELISHAAY
ncbi:hypothetical protein [Stenotrophomonas oahuensis]|uniref:Uncharacterized protein n=1 Tax=Stenotrophomonas oahuensis TaxID=3003271 RepID=A0ABY9YTT5_9GAMM|nr:hypothetical protein [Stenotrophomonas sp. A5586]WNH54349.1 hypothetical protein PDM29_08740 [Stenotrophomonas sp. A5586]